MTRAAISPRCSKKLLVAEKRTLPAAFQKSLATSMAMAVRQASPPAPSQTSRFAITQTDPPSSTAIASAAQSHPGRSPKCSCSATAAGKCTSLVTPPRTYADTSAARAIGRSQRHPRIALTHPGLPALRVLTSDRPARAAERAPECAQVGGRRIARPCARVTVAVYRAGGGAPARGGGDLLQRGFAFPARARSVLPRREAAEPAHR